MRIHPLVRSLPQSVNSAILVVSLEPLMALRDSQFAKPCLRAVGAKRPRAARLAPMTRPQLPMAYRPSPGWTS
jgi:hypothetical protein